MVIGRIVIPSGEAKDLIGNEVLTCTVALYDSRHHVLRHFGIVGKELLRIFRKTVAAITERGVVVVRADARIKADTFDDSLGVKSLDLGICMYTACNFPDSPVIMISTIGSTFP